ncbi:MAG: hypothetical protein A3F04_01640 [Candidatus Chisholmbacteria bacterium RIFCSPHIGHO2_12_FULL_49_9]|uniref:DNA 3'-5' helicase n=1 Tax=Candidatus Chisholmbacteria bacterium RIFCSPHIGHO2_01_FULL_52_32 TaxID=1797591 RepID=A0A1G1VUL3_9BACT|nr:MAG: hypothetical protein A2786_06230 [Candidatus Chisholmbacteria bacterium RIFCSPHIGHO2_01_FULL_52_32]OGY19700.1 MAG: hypothetical protein A2900_01170 [Candidatus Chisholmbacteria bacterium RIFCSPLOWO2_01_FULL_50_28]OGY20709.1 MAG: hypothetical protein A3F04_01640 [Candidatus Chisholmbacteria bacterium RIFCSPHIGHO2_12_FULL_49_9]
MAENISLNRQQKIAINHNQGPLLIIAGAGTGKTTVITERIKRLITKGRAKPAEILALTFTEKAAREMEERIDIAMPYGYVQMWVATFHAFCDRLLRAEAINIGLDSSFRLLTEAESLLFLRRRLFDFALDYFRPHGNPTKFLQGILEHFNRLKDEDVSSQQYKTYAESLAKKDTEERKKTLELALAYETYERLKVKEGIMDFADLISNTLKLLRTRRNILAMYQKQFNYILVDEFQDTNIAQNEIAMLLAGKRANLTCVCDDDQAIYRWRGAAVSNIIQFKKRFPNAKIISLTRNYRSTQEILDRSYDLIQHNNPDRLEVKERINKKLISYKGKRGEKIRFLFTNRVEDEAESVGKEIQHLIKRKAYDWKDIAILVRANNHAEPFIRTLIRKGIPFQFLGPGQLFRQEEVKDLIAYLKLLANYEDSVAMYRMLTMKIFDLSPRDFAALRVYAKKTNTSLFEACEIIAKKSPVVEKRPSVTISQEGRTKIDNLMTMIHRHLRLLPKETAGQILYYFLEDSGLLREISDYKTPQEEQQAQNLAKFFDKLKTFEAEHDDASVEAVLDWITMKMELGESPLAADTDWTEENRVNILTVHSAKGLEFPVIFLTNLVSERFPTRERKERIPIPEKLIKEILPEGDAHEQEERRLFYVGMTRAKENLYMTAAKFYAEGKRQKHISPFVVEALGIKEEILKTQGQLLSGDQPLFIDWKKEASPKERKSPTQVDSLSFSQIETFKTCPLQYRYRYLLRIPVPQSHAQSFGTSIHDALADFYTLHKGGSKPTKKDLLKALKKRWQSPGYAGSLHEKKAYAKAKKMLSDYFDTAYDPKEKVLTVEEPFKVRIEPQLWLTGRIDRLNAEGQGKVEIIDYKTGKVPSQKEVETSLQMTIYALAATQGAYAIRPQGIELSFFYLDAKKKMTTHRSQSDIAKASQTIGKIKEAIESSDFNPTPGKWCDFCDFRLLCPAWR